MKKWFVYLFLLLGSRAMGAVPEQEVYVRLAGNAYVTSQEKGARITDRGLEKWIGDHTVVSVYFSVPKAGTLDLALKAKGTSRIKVTLGEKDFQVRLSANDFQEIPVGTVEVVHPGYVRVDLKGLKKSGDTYGEVEGIRIKGPEGKWIYVENFSSYWGRRGPSVHLGYQLPKGDIEWFYNEVTVPEDGEIRGSYYMVNGFGEGYFGMQYNSETERRILFSVWSPFDTQDPKKIPEEKRIRMFRKGKGVHVGEFGNEGSGGQSFLKYNWKAGVTYPFLMQVRPDGKGNTVYTAYFYATDEGHWRLIASFLRPETTTWYRHAHSFLENFSPEQGYLSRRVFFDNQWACDYTGKWYELNEAGFTYDATAGAGVRQDYQGGVTDGGKFYLKNGGFFEQPTPYRTNFKRELKGKQPQIDFKELEKL